MTETPHGSSGLTTPGGAPAHDPVAELELDRLTPGAVWRGAFQVVEAVSDITYGKSVIATHAKTGERVVIRSFRVMDDYRARTWSQLSGYKGDGLVGLLEAHEVAGRRVEVTRAPQGQTLNAWAAGKPLKVAAIKPILAQIVETLDALHRAQVVHLNLKPESLLVQMEEGGPQVTVSGLEAAVDFGKPGLVSVTVDPFYAPPEAIGLFQHHCGPALRAWDWWSLGRIIQELALGQHVLGLLINRDVSRRTPELLLRADQFLREKDGSATRAGGVEAMPPMEPELTTLLRGLLTSSRDARWGAAEVRAWLKGESVKERYHLSRHERLFVWKDHAYSVVEAAEFFAQAENWNDGLENIFGEAKPATLMAFLGEDGAYRKLRDRVLDLIKLPESSAYANLKAPAARDVVAGLAFSTLSGGALPMHVRGRRIDAAYLTSLLAPAAQPQGFDLVEVLLERTTTQLISTVDAEAARLLTEMDRIYEGAVTLSVRHRWMTRAERTHLARVGQLSLTPEAELRSRVSAAKEKYAVTRDEALNELFQKESLSGSELVAVAFAIEDPNKRQFVTHDAWTKECHQRLCAQGEKLAIALTWLNLARAMRSGPHVFMPWILVIVFWLALGACLAAAFPSRITLGAGVLIVAVGVAFRFALVGLTARELKIRLAGAKMPKSLGGCEAEASRALGQGSIPALKTLRSEFHRTLAEISGLKPTTPLPGPRAPASFQIGRVGALATGLVCVAAFGGLGYRVAKHPPQPKDLVNAWLRPPQETPKPPEEEKVQEKRGKEAKNDPKDQKISWNYRAPLEVTPVRVSDTREATPEQTKAARENGERLTAPYILSTINTLIAVKVPTDSGVGLMLYDGRSAKVADKRVYIVGYLPLERSWMLVGDRTAVFLDNP